MDVHNNDRLSKILHLLGGSGASISEDSLSGKKINKSIFQKDEMKIFNHFNTNGDDVLDETELKTMLKSLFEGDTNGDNNLLPVEIAKLVKTYGLKGRTNAYSVVNFVEKIVNHIDIENLSDGSFERDVFAKIPPDEVSNFINQYNAVSGKTIVDDILDVNIFKRTKTLNLLRDKLVEQANLLGIDSTKFVEDFNKEIDGLLPVFDTESNRSKINTLVKNFINEMKSKAEIYSSNKNGIINMLSDPKLCYSKEDLNLVIDNIMNYANKYNPKERLEELSIKNPKAKAVVNDLLKSNFLDYYPLYVASIIAQESQFREQEDAIFTERGRGVMQITNVIVKDMYSRGDFFDDTFLDSVKAEYPDSTSFYNAIKDQNNVDLNYETGINSINAKLFESINLLARNKYKVLKIDSAEDLLELTAMNYNSNNDPKKDPVYSGKMSQVRYVYARDVITRFKKYTPEGVTVRSYFEYNPKTKRWVYK